VEAKRAVPRHEVARETSPSKPSNQTHSNGNYHTGNNHHFHSDTHLNSDEQQYCKIFVGGLHYDTRDGLSASPRSPPSPHLTLLISGEFRHYFEQYGKVISAEVMFNRETHKSRGFGFIIFDNEASVDQVCDEREHTIDGKTVSQQLPSPSSLLLPHSARRWRSKELCHDQKSAIRRHQSQPLLPLWPMLLSQHMHPLLLRKI
jgi:hypothetical protein